MRSTPPSTNKNNINGRKKRQYLANGQSDFNGTKKIGINTRNYTRQSQRIKDSNENRTRSHKIGYIHKYWDGEKKVQGNETATQMDRRITIGMGKIIGEGEAQKDPA